MPTVSLRRWIVSVVHRTVRGRDVRMIAGVGRGLRFNSGESNTAYALGRNEPPVQEALARYLHRGGVLYDVGANVGFFTVIGARLVGPTGRVYAFEPLPANASQARHNVSLNGFEHVQVVERAVSSKTGADHLLVARYSGGSALSTAGGPPDQVGSLEVETVSIDDFVDRSQSRVPTVIKIDVEGAELAVLKGAVRTIERARPVIIYEIDDETQQGLDLKMAQCRTLLQQHAYSFSRLPDSYGTRGWHVAHVLALPPSPRQ